MKKLDLDRLKPFTEEMKPFLELGLHQGMEVLKINDEYFIFYEGKYRLSCRKYFPDSKK